MNFRELLEFAFREGCGTSIERLSDVPDGAALLQMYRLRNETPDKQDMQRWGPILYASHLRQGLPASLADGRGRLPLSDEAVEDLAMVDLLGSMLATVATNELPPDVVEEAKTWRTLNAEGQLAMIARLVSALKEFERSLTQAVENEERCALAATYGPTFAFVVSQRTERILPHARLKAKRPGLVNCLGMTQLLVAFAQLAGARHYVLGLIEGTDIVAHEIRQRLATYHFQECLERRILGQEESERMLAEITVANFNVEMWRQMFHSALLLQLADKRWVYFDPFMAAWGVVPVESTIEALESSMLALPGLCLPRKFANTEKTKIEAEFRTAQTRIDKALEVRKMMFERLIEIENDPNSTTLQFAQAIMSSAWFAIVTELMTEEGEPPWTDQRKENFAWWLAFGPEGAKRWCDDDNYRETQILELRALLPELEIQRVGRQVAALAKGRGLLPPMVEIGHAAFQLGHRTLLDLAAYCDADDDAIRRLMTMSNSQPSLTAGAIHLAGDELMVVSLSGYKHHALRDAMNHASLQRLEEWCVAQTGGVSK